MNTCIHTHAHTCTQHMHTNTHMHTHTCMQHMHMHTHMHQVLHLHAVNHALGRLNPPLSKNESEDKEKDVLTSWLSKLRLSQNAIDSILNLPSQTELANRARWVCVCVFDCWGEWQGMCSLHFKSAKTRSIFSLILLWRHLFVCCILYIEYYQAELHSIL